MVSFSDAVDSALQTEFEMKFDGYELLELYNLLLSQPAKSLHLQVIAREIFDVFFGRVARLSSLPFDDVENG